MLNNLCITGRLVADPEMRQTAGGTNVCRFTIAVERNVKAGADGKRPADFFNVNAWERQAEVVSKHFCKGQMIQIEGSLITGKYADRNYPSVTHHTVEINAKNVYYCGAKPQSENAPAPVTQQQTYTPPTGAANAPGGYTPAFADEFMEVSADDLPF